MTASPAAAYLTMLVRLLTGLAVCAAGNSAAAQRPTQVPAVAPQRLPAQDRGGRSEDRTLVAPDFFRPLVMVDAEIDPAGRVPRDASEGLFQPASQTDTSRDVAETHVAWAASDLDHQPLYWQELMLERHGVSVAPRLQPWISGAHFFGNFLIMPYKLGLDHPHRFVSVYGQGRPGRPMPCVRERLPWENPAALSEAGAIAGLIWLIP
jgi:hypothetical protein